MRDNVIKRGAHTFKKKIKPPKGYPPEEGRYTRGNDYSPVALCVILNTFDFQIPSELEELVMVGLDTGAALSGMLQTENIEIEKIVCNIVANPNIRYIVLCGREACGHLPGETLIRLVENGVDERERIIGSNAPTPYLPNIPREVIERFREQITIIDLIGCMDREVVFEAVKCCYQENSIDFSYKKRKYRLYDPGAFGEPLFHKIIWKVEKPWLADGRCGELALTMRDVTDVKRNKKRMGIIRYLSGIMQAHKGELKDIFDLSDWELNFHLDMLKKRGGFVEIYKDMVMITKEGEYLVEILKEKR